MNYLALQALHKVSVSTLLPPAPRSQLHPPEICPRARAAAGACAAAVQPAARQSHQQHIQGAPRFAVLICTRADRASQEYERTGYVWEQYNARTGHGQRNKPFTGWTSLVALIMAEKY